MSQNSTQTPKIQGLTPQLKRAWLKKALESQRDAIKRSRQKEMPESEIYALRTRELQQLDQIYNEISLGVDEP